MELDEKNAILDMSMKICSRQFVIDSFTYTLSANTEPKLLLRVLHYVQLIHLFG